MSGLRGLLLLINLLSLIPGLQAQQLKKYTDEDTKELIYKGKLTFDDLQKEPKFKWYTDGVKSYKVDDEVIKLLAPKLKGHTIVVFMGTWCEDTHVLIPQLKNVLQACNFPLSKVTMYALDLEKKGLNGEESKYKVKLLPTIILLEDGAEVTRIVETANFDSLETDMLTGILQNSGFDSSD